MKLHRKNLNMETELILNELYKIQKRLDSLEEENKVKSSSRETY